MKTRRFYPFLRSEVSTTRKEEMARPSACNPLSYLITRQIDNKVDHCKRLVNARFNTSEDLFRKDLLSHYGCVNAIEFSNQGDLLVSGKKLKYLLNLSLYDITLPSILKVGARRKTKTKFTVLHNFLLFTFFCRRNIFLTYMRFNVF